MSSLFLAASFVSGDAAYIVGQWYLWGKGYFERELDVLFFGVESLVGLDPFFAQFVCNAHSPVSAAPLVGSAGGGVDVAGIFSQCALSPHRLIAFAVDPTDAHLV